MPLTNTRPPSVSSRREASVAVYPPGWEVEFATWVHSRCSSTICTTNGTPPQPGRVSVLSDTAVTAAPAQGGGQQPGRPRHLLSSADPESDHRRPPLPHAPVAARGQSIDGMCWAGVASVRFHTGRTEQFDLTGRWLPSTVGICMHTLRSWRCHPPSLCDRGRGGLTCSFDRLAGGSARRPPAGAAERASIGCDRVHARIRLALPR